MDKVLKDKLDLFWTDKYVRVYLSTDRTIEYWGYSRVRFIPIGQYVYSLLNDGSLSKGGFLLLTYITMRVKYTYDPIVSGGAFVSYDMSYYSKRFSNRNFYRFKKELVELGLIIKFHKSYYIFNSLYINKIRNRKVVK